MGEGLGQSPPFQLAVCRRSLPGFVAAAAQAFKDHVEVAVGAAGVGG